MRAAPTQHRPRIAVLLGHYADRPAPSRLAAVVRSVAHDDAGMADITVYDKELGQLLGFARGLERAGEVDAFVCSGTAGAFLRPHLAVPVALMRVNGFDLLAALHEASQIADRVALFSRQPMPAELTAAASLFNVRLEHCLYTGIGDLRRRVAEVAQAGVRVVIGTSMVTEYAQSVGLAGILSMARHSAREALDDALAYCRRAQAESHERLRLDAMLAHLDDGVMALDAEGTVQAMNPAMAAALGLRRDEAVGRPLAELAPALAGAIAGGTHEEYRLVHHGERALVLSSAPVLVQGAHTGVVVKCQDSEAVARADRRLRSSRRAPRLNARYHLYQILGESTAIRNTARLAEQYARTDSTVLITGETGTGKELLAQGIHNASRRSKGPFVAINCAALPETLLESELFGYEEGAFSGSRKGGKPGLFELAHTGTLFLDEIGDMPLSLQTRLLRVLQEQEVLRLGGTEPTPIDVRIVAATHRDLAARMARGEFREDLYYRINILRLYAPPLRERPQDIPEIVRHLARDAAARQTQPVDLRALLDALLPAMQDYAWPGNVRELANVVERAVVSLAATTRESPATLLRRSVPELFAGRPVPTAAPAASPDLRGHLRAVARERAHEALAACHNDHEEAARRLGISRTTLWRRLRG